MPLGPAMGALIAGSANSVMPMMTPNNDFNAKLVNVRVMMMRPLVAYASRGQINDATASRVPSTRRNVWPSADFCCWALFRHSEGLSGNHLLFPISPFGPKLPIAVSIIPRQAQWSNSLNAIRTPADARSATARTVPSRRRPGTRSQPSFANLPIPSPRRAWRPADFRRNKLCGMG
jgi:hypothetical protein